MPEHALRGSVTGAARALEGASPSRDENRVAQLENQALQGRGRERDAGSARGDARGPALATRGLDIGARRSVAPLPGQRRPRSRSSERAKRCQMGGIGAKATARCPPRTPPRDSARPSWTSSPARVTTSRRARRSSRKNDPDADVRQRGHGPVQGRLHGQEKRPYQPRRPRARSASASAASTTTSRTSGAPRVTTPSSRCSATSASATTSRKTPSPSPGSSSPRSSRCPRIALVVTVFGGDGGIAGRRRGARHLAKVTGFGDDRIIGIGHADNFWQMGDTGPCGPCTEIHFFHGDRARLRRRFGEEPRPTARAGSRSGTSSSCSSSVRSRRDRQARRRSPTPCIDTGAGLERVAASLQGHSSNYDTDLLRALVDKAAAHREASPTAGRMATTTSRCASSPITRVPRRSSIAEGVLPDRAGASTSCAA